MHTYLQLKQQIAQLTQHVSYDSAGTGTYDANFMDKAGIWLNLSQSMLAKVWDYWTELQSQTPHTFTTVDGTEAYDMPADFDKPYKVVDLTNKVILTPYAEEDYIDENVSAIADADEGTPTKYRIFGVSSRLKQMLLGLIPDDAYSMKVWYKLLPTAMSADGDYPFIRNADEYFIFDGVGYALRWENKDEKANFAWQKAKEALGLILSNQSRKLGTDYVNKIVSKWASAHRQ